MSGSTLYGGLLDRCTVNSSAEIFLETQNITLLDGVTYIQNVTNINLSSIASDPVQFLFVRIANQTAATNLTSVTQICVIQTHFHTHEQNV